MNNLRIHRDLMTCTAPQSGAQILGRMIIGFSLTLMMFFYGFSVHVYAQTMGSAKDVPDPVSFRISIELGDTDKAEKWLNSGLDPNFLGDKLGSALHIAAWNGDIKMMALFHAKGARLNQLNKNGETPLLMASLQGKIAAAEWLINKGANINPPVNPNAPDPSSGAWSALHYAAFSGKKELVTRLLEKGADLNARAPNGTTPLMAAIYEGKRDVAEYLVRQGADRTLKNDWGDGALEWAIKYNQADLARLISSPEQFASAYSRIKETRRSEPAPPDLLKLLAEREQLLNKKESTDKVDNAIAALRASYARRALAEIRERAKPTIATLSPLIIRPSESQKKRLLPAQ